MDAYCAFRRQYGGAKRNRGAVAAGSALDLHRRFSLAPASYLLASRPSPPPRDARLGEVGHLTWVCHRLEMGRTAIDQGREGWPPPGSCAAREHHLPPPARPARGGTGRLAGCRGQTIVRVLLGHRPASALCSSARGSSSSSGVGPCHCSWRPTPLPARVRRPPCSTRSSTLPPRCPPLGSASPAAGLRVCIIETQEGGGGKGWGGGRRGEWDEEWDMG
ncbi:unnamed protein product [Urochloa humidicola]